MLHRTLLVALALTVSACFPPAPVYSSYTSATSKYISTVVSGNTPGAPLPADVDKAIGIYVSVCAKRYTEAKCLAAIKPVVLEWSGVIAPSPSTGALNTVVVLNGTLYSGATVGISVRVAWRGKISRSALIHELGHVVGTYILGDPNGDHTNTELKALEDEANAEVAKAGL